MKVFYSDKQNVDTNVSYSPSAGKPAKVLKDWLSLGLDVQVVEPSPATVEDLARAHSPSYVKGVLSLKLANGFNNLNPDVAASLPWTSGSFMSAAIHAIQTGETVASLTSGFHHAGYENGGGYCTFNGLMVAFLKLRSMGFTGKIGIIDCDAHYGDGTEDILRSLCLDDYRHYTLGAERTTPENSDKWVNVKFPRVLETFSDCDVIFYQAGADPHINDPIGGQSLTTEQMLKRDYLVFQFAKRNNIPVVWNLAGGYQRNFEAVLELHSNTAKACIEVFGSSVTLDRKESTSAF